MRTAAFTVTLLLGVASLAACSHPAAPTKAEYIAAADTICAATEDASIPMLVEYEKTKPDEGDAQRFIRQKAIPQVRGMLNQLNGLRPPANEGAYLRSMYQDEAHVLDLVYADPLGDSYDTASDAADHRLEVYGMKRCAEFGDNKAYEKKLKAAEEKAKVPKANRTSDA